MPVGNELSDNSWSALLDAQHHGCVVLDEHGALLGINATAARLLGFPKADFALLPAESRAFFTVRLGETTLASVDGDLFRTVFTVEASDGASTLSLVLMRTGHGFYGLLEPIYESAGAERLMKRNRELEALRLLAADAMNEADRDALVTSMLDVCIHTIGADGGGLYLFDLATKRLRLQSARPASTDLFEKRREIRLGEGITGKVAVTQLPVIVNDASKERLEGFDEIRREGVRAFVSIPLKVSRKLLGVLDLFTLGDRDFTGSDVAVLEALAAQVSLSLDHNLHIEELRERNNELERFNRLAVDRELRMIELKMRIRELEAALKQAEKSR